MTPEEKAWFFIRRIAHGGDRNHALRLAICEITGFEFSDERVSAVLTEVLPHVILMERNSTMDQMTQLDWTRTVFSYIVNSAKVGNKLIAPRSCLSFNEEALAELESEDPLNRLAAANACLASGVPLSLLP